MIYLDNSATTFPKPECVYEIIDKTSRNAFNAGRGAYNQSKDALKTIDNARIEIASFVNANPSKVIFTSSATEALNTIINGIGIKDGDNVYVTPFEHNAIIRTLNAKKANINIIPFDKKDWKVDIHKLNDMFAIRKPKAVFVSQISNVTGFEPDYGIIFEHSVRYNAINVLDAAQGYGIVPIHTNNVNYVVFAGHKSLYGSFGVGGFVKLSNDNLIPYMYGGTGSDSLNPNMPENCPEKYEAGSHNIVAISALLEGAKWIKKENIEENEREITNYLVKKLRKNNKIKLFIPYNDNVIGIVSLAIKGYDSDDVAAILAEDFDICVRSGYHCAPYVHDFIGSKEYKGTVRVSVSAFTKKEEIDSLVKALEEIA